MFIELEEITAERIELRQQAHYWRSRHADAVRRQAAAKEKILQLEQNQQIEKLKAEVAWLRQMVFGRKSEQSFEPAPEYPAANCHPLAPACRRSIESAGNNREAKAMAENTAIASHGGSSP